MQQTIAAGKFKAQCLQLMNEVQKHHSSIIITKHGKPIAELIPYEPSPSSKTNDLFGYMKGSLTIIGDVMSPIADVWDAQKDE